MKMDNIEILKKMLIDRAETGLKDSTEKIIELLIKEVSVNVRQRSMR